jgi:hypothetical protein
MSHDASVDDKTGFALEEANDFIEGIGMISELKVGDVVIDNKFRLWKLQRCFCENRFCNGRALRLMEGKLDLDAYDKGRPQEPRRASEN